MVTVKAGEAAVVKLGPLGTVTGTLLDPDGQPLAGAIVRVGPDDNEAGGELYRYLRAEAKPAVTDKAGAFTLTDALPSLPFYLNITRGSASYGGDLPIGKRTLSAGGRLDLGVRKTRMLQ